MFNGLVITPDVPIFSIMTLFSYSVYGFTGGLALAVHVNSALTPLQTLLEMRTSKDTFSGLSARNNASHGELMNCVHVQRGTL